MRADSPDAAASRRARVLQLDVLRALAILLVLGRHMPAPPADLGPLSTLLEGWQRGGWVGVDLFFVLSGFLVSGLLYDAHHRHGQVDVRRFLVRRGFKIYPVFWAFLAIGLVVDTVIGRQVLRCVAPDQCEPVSRGAQAVVELTFLQNYSASWFGIPPLWGHTWSLAVEEHFYLLLAALVVVLVHRNPSQPFRRVPAIAGLLLIGCLALRVLTASSLPEPSISNQLYPTHLRIDSLFVGVALAYLWRHHETLRGPTVRRHRWSLIAAGSVLLLVPAFVDVETTMWMLTIGLTMLATGAAMVLIGALHCRPTPGRLLSALAFIGVYSYAIYLLHNAISEYLGRYVIPDDLPTWILVFAAYVSASITFGWLLSKAVERPMLAVRDRRFPNR